MKNELLTKGIILPSGEIGKDKINLVAGAITQPFAEMVWVTTGGDMETINRLTNILVTMNNPTDRGKLFKIIKLFYGLTPFPAFGRNSRLKSSMQRRRNKGAQRVSKPQPRIPGKRQKKPQRKQSRQRHLWQGTRRAWQSLSVRCFSLSSLCRGCPLAWQCFPAP